MAGLDVKAYKGRQKAPKKQQENSGTSLLNRELSLFPYTISDKKKEAFYLELSTM